MLIKLEAMVEADFNYLVVATPDKWAEIKNILIRYRVIDTENELLGALCQIDVQSLPQVRKSFGGGGVLGWFDISKKDGFPIKAAFFDMDSTVVDQESIVLIAEVVGLEKQVGFITEEAMAGRIDFEEALRQRVKLLNGISEQDFLKAGDKLTYKPGIRELVYWLHAFKVTTHLVSGGFRGLTDVVVENLGFNFQHANHLEIKDGNLTGACQGLIVDGPEKLRWAKKKASDLAIKNSAVLGVGDGSNDSWLLGWGGCSIGFQPKETLFSVVQFYCGKNDHRYILEALKLWKKHSSK